jgi:hypothetical protein
MSGNNESFCQEIEYYSYLWQGGQAGRISGRAAGLVGRSSKRGGGGTGCPKGEMKRLGGLQT